jgi:cytochrome c biogenesis protein CcdA/thiol-disulfide isomerase/thioredoxin
LLLLTLFAFVAGAGTAISPCVLPVLPALLSAGATGGRRRPFGIVLGHAVTFTVTIVGLSEVVDGVGLGDGITRSIAIFALLAFGLAVLIPAIGDRLEAPLSRLARFGPKDTGGDGFWSGVAIGGALGFVYAPCAGPILAAVITVSAASGQTLLVGLGYAAGSSLVLLGLALGGRRVIDRVRAGGRGPLVQRAIGVVMVATAIAMVADLDVRFQTAIASHLPDAVVNPTKGLEDSDSVKNRLADLRGKSRFEERQDAARAAKAPTAAAAAGSVADDPGLPGVVTPELADLGPAPEFRGNQRWWNTPGDKPLTLAGLKGKVVLVDFWTYTCINCIRTLPYLKAWNAKYASKGLTIVGVHAPEFAFEKKASNVTDAIRQNGLEYPIAQDNDMATWNAWGNQYWPAKYLIDAKGEVRYVHFGEGDYEESEAAIRALLAERGSTGLGAGAKAKDTIPVSRTQITPETYLGTARAQGFVPSGPRDGTQTYKPATGEDLPLNAFSLGGTWKADAESATAVSGSTIDATFQAAHVYLVLASAGDRARPVQVSVDGRRTKTVSVTRQKLYTLVDLPKTGQHALHLDLPPGVSAFAFTFG